jgi:hypothetical protein
MEDLWRQKKIILINLNLLKILCLSSIIISTQKYMNAEIFKTTKIIHLAIEINSYSRHIHHHILCKPEKVHVLKYVLLKEN